MSTTPKGVIAIATDDDGDVIATHTDFARQGYGGFTLPEAQHARVRRAVRWAVVRAYCTDVIVTALSDYLVDQICDALTRAGTVKITYRVIGWGPDIAEVIER